MISLSSARIFCLGLLLSTCISQALADVVIERSSDQRVTVPHEDNNRASIKNIQADPFWTLSEQLQQLQQEVQALRGLSDEQSHKIEQLERQQKDNYTDVDQRITALSKGGTTTQPSSAVVNASVNPQDFYDEKQRYQAVQQLVKDKKLVEAQKALIQFLKDFPKGAFTANAHYWLGEVDMVLPKPDLDQAQYHFSYIVQNYPNHAKVPASLYKLGTIYDVKGQKQKAEALFNQVIKQYPSSTAAQLAQRYLTN